MYIILHFPECITVYSNDRNWGEFMIKGSCNLIGREHAWSHPIKSGSLILPYINDYYLHVKSLRYRLIPYKNIDDHNPAM